MSKKIKSLICLLLLMLSALSLSAQQNKRLTVQVQNGTILDCIKSIENQSNYTFLFNNSIGVDKKVSVNLKNKTLSEVLATVFTPNGIGYDISDNQITLKLAQNQQVEGGVELLMENSLTVTASLLSEPE